MTSNAYYAHTLPGRPPADWEPLGKHLREVAEIAGNFAHAFDARAWGHILGAWHDLGKYSDAFQEYLHRPEGNEAHVEDRGRVDHATAGAKYVAAHVPTFGPLLAFVLAGHHSGLADFDKLATRLAKNVDPWEHHADASLLSVPELGFPLITVDRDDRARFGFQCGLFARMLFSCLIDADRLATEAFCEQEKAAKRAPAIDIGELIGPSNAYLQRIAAVAPPTDVNQHRQEIVVACCAAAAHEPGFFSLTVPTGGGKTLSSLAFALRHAELKGLRRVVVAIPFTSIIEQTAKEYRKVFFGLGEGVLVEHHTNVDPKRDTRANMLAAENWDAPLIVTTNVQLFESLFSSRTTPCRKLHRLAGSVIILDEAQTLPVRLLRPCLAALRELVTDYGCSIVLCTATQPALERRDKFLIGLEGVREIVPQPEKLYAAMKRVDVDNLGKLDDEQLLEHLDREPAWLTIVNTRAHAAALYDELRRRAPDGRSSDDLFHLSTLMCGEHRARRIDEMKSRLAAGQSCRVVSTQLIEAGVDISFPVVFRAMAGIDSIAQAAGRCNRHGELPAPGHVYVFDPAEVQPRGDLGATAATARELLPDYDDILSLEAVRRYFEMHYWNHGAGQPKEVRWDDSRVMECFPEEFGKFAYDFRTADERFQFIKNATQPIFISYEVGEQLIEQLRSVGPSRWLLRKLQRYIVGLHEPDLNTLLASSDVELLDSGYYVLSNSDLYDQQLGLRLDRPGYRKPEAMIG